MNEKEIDFFLKIENTLYLDIPFSRKMEYIINFIAEFYKPEIAAFISISHGKKKDRFAILCAKEKNRLNLRLLIEENNVFKKKLPDLKKIFENFDNNRHEYILPISHAYKGNKFLFLYLSFIDNELKGRRELELLLKLLQNYYKYYIKMTSLKKEYNQTKLLYNIAKTIDTLDEININKSFSKIMKFIKKSISYDYFSLYIKKEDETLVRVDLGSSYEIDLLHDFKFHFGIGLSAWVATAERPVIINDLYKKRRFRLANDINPYINSIISMPLLFKGKVVGVLNLARNYPYKFYKKNLKMLEIIGSQIASTLENIKLLNKLENMAYTDGLTGLFNYRYFIHEFEKELKRAERYAYEVSLIIIDIDDFKKVNDKFGHNVGNIVLKKLSSILSTALRNVDILARYGGEEFVILLPNTDKEGAGVLAERLRKNIKEEFLKIYSEDLPSITITLGVSTFPEDGNNIYELIKNADIALYEGKRLGKDKAILYKGTLLDEKK